MFGWFVEREYEVEDVAVAEVEFLTPKNANGKRLKYSQLPITPWHMLFMPNKAQREWKEKEESHRLQMKTFAADLQKPIMFQMDIEIISVTLTRVESYDKKGECIAYLTFVPDMDSVRILQMSKRGNAFQILNDAVFRATGAADILRGEIFMEAHASMTTALTHKQAVTHALMKTITNNYRTYWYEVVNRLSFDESISVPDCDYIDNRKVRLVFLRKVNKTEPYYLYLNIKGIVFGN